MQALQMVDVLEQHGPRHLETWPVPLLSWNELQELKAHYEPKAGSACCPRGRAPQVLRSLETALPS